MHYAVHTDAQVCCSSRNDSIDPSNTLFDPLVNASPGWLPSVMLLIPVVNNPGKLVPMEILPAPPDVVTAMLLLEN